MGIYDENIRGAYVGKQVVCVNCLTDKENDGLKQTELITDDNCEEKEYFCDRCNKRL